MKKYEDLDAFVFLKSPKAKRRRREGIIDLLASFG
jgi:hypothetical protein